MKKSKFFAMSGESSMEEAIGVNGASVSAGLDMIAGDEETVEEDSKGVIYTSNNHIFFYQDINADTALVFNKLITEMYFDIINVMVSSGLSNPSIEVHIKSDGGEITSALAMIKKIKEIQKGFGSVKVPMAVNTHIEGEACSAATMVSCVGTYRTISEWGIALIHKGSTGFSGKTGDIDDFVHNSTLLQDLMRRIYKEHSKISDEDLSRELQDDKAFSAKEFFDYGFVDEIV